MSKDNQENNQGKEPRGNKYTYFLAGAACMLVIAAIVFCAVWFGGGFANQSGGSTHRGGADIVFESGGFSSPEDAVRAYIEGYKKIDVEEMLSAFAIETFVNNYVFEEQVINNLTFSTVLSSNLVYPNKCKVLIRDNIYQRLFQLEKEIVDQVMGYVDIDFSGINVDEYAPEEQQALIDKVIGLFPYDEDFGAFSSLTIVKILSPEEMGAKSENDDPSVKEYVDAAFKTYGIKELRDMVVSCNIGGQGYYLTFTAFKYGNKWFLGEVGASKGVSLLDGVQIIKGLYKKEQ